MQERDSFNRIIARYFTKRVVSVFFLLLKVFIKDAYWKTLAFR